jgi:membrane protein implicated in regulation of membrane protease activity
MDFLLSSWFWLITGIVCIVAELVIPGGIIMFLGIAGLIVASALVFGLVETWTSVLTLWFISSLALVILLRSFAQKYVGGDTSVASTDEELDAFGELVDVVEDIGPGLHKGRVIFRDTEWDALGDGELIRAGELAKFVARDNICLIVAPTRARDIN